MKKWMNNSKKGMAVFGAVAFMLVAGWQFGVGGTEAPFSEREVALENAISGSGAGCLPEKVNAIAVDNGNGIDCIKCGGSCCVNSCDI